MTDLRHTHRLFVPTALDKGATIEFSKEQAHQILHVLRLKTGDVLRVFNGKHGEFTAALTRVDKKGVEAQTQEQLRPQTANPDLWFCGTPIKKAHFDFMLEKATELGVSEIQPILTQRTQVREINADRLYALCREAAEQSDRLDVPAIGLPVSLQDFIDVFPKDRLMIVCAEWGDAEPIHIALNKDDVKKFDRAAIVTGPEGGFAAEELDALRHAPNALFVRLGPRILRADTAAIAALTCWQAIRGDWK